jgi:pilus assembly protein CpaF
MVDARLPDGSRVNAVVPPIAVDGSSLTIRTFAREPYTAFDLITLGTLTRPATDVLRACVQGRLNILISGGTGSGKTTTLNVMSSFIPDDDRIITIEDAAELQLPQPHVMRLESRPANVEGQGQVTIRDLVRNSLRMRPDRIIVGEVRDAAALDMLQAMNTGHEGSLSTVHANTPRDALSRIETMVLMAGMEMPIRVIREQVISAMDLVVHQSRLRDGTRHVTQISEIVGLDGDTVLMHDLFSFDYSRGSESGPLGHLVPSGIVPHFTERLRDRGIEIPVELFTR